MGGGMLFGIGWGIAGLGPGPAIADLALRPLEAGVFVLAMLAGFALHRLVDRPAPARRPATASQTGEGLWPPSRSATGCRSRRNSRPRTSMPRPARASGRSSTIVPMAREQGDRKGRVVGK